MTKLEERRAEFKQFVWNHAEDAFQIKYDECPPLPPGLISWLSSLLAPGNLRDMRTASAAISAAVASNPEHLLRLLQLLGLTRNKIITDLKPTIRTNGLRISTSTAAALFKSEAGAKLAADYLAPKVITVFGGLSEATASVLKTINQATWPGYIRQQRAKESGHEAERRIAFLLYECGLPFEPEEKLENPKCGDKLIDGVSYDIVSPSVEAALMRVKSTVHTSNIGQYGESKDDLEIREARKSIDKDRNRASITLVAMIDGIGFESNSAGLNGVLENADEFCQYRTIWKIATVAASKSGRDVTVALPRDQIAQFAAFCKRHGAKLVTLDDEKDRKAWVTAGDGLIQIGEKRVGAAAR